MQEFKWYLIYTHPNAEKRLVVRLEDANIESYLPTITEEHQWSDRIKTIHVPLFKSYLFVRADLEQYHQIKRLGGFSHYVKFDKKAASVPEVVISKIKAAVSTVKDIQSVPTTSLRKGMEVEINTGSLKGYKGFLVASPEGRKVAIEVTGIEQCLVMSIPTEMLSPIQGD